MELFSHFTLFLHVLLALNSLLMLEVKQEYSIDGNYTI